MHFETFCVCAGQMGKLRPRDIAIIMPLTAQDLPAPVPGLE